MSYTVIQELFKRIDMLDYDYSDGTRAWDDDIFTEFGIARVYKDYLEELSSGLTCGKTVSSLGRLSSRDIYSPMSDIAFKEALLHSGEDEYSPILGGWILDGFIDREFFGNSVYSTARCLESGAYIKHLFYAYWSKDNSHYYLDSWSRALYQRGDIDSKDVIIHHRDSGTIDIQSIGEEDYEVLFDYMSCIKLDLIEYKNIFKNISRAL